MRGRSRLAVAGVVVAAGGQLAAGATAATQDTLAVQCTPAAQGACDQSGAWQTSAMTVTFIVTTAQNDSIAKWSGCGFLPFQPQSYTDAATTASCEVWWSGGAHQLLTFPLNVEGSDPTATAVPTRPADSNGWYNHPVAVRFQGAKSFSGFSSSSCGAATYSGPDTSNTTVSGSCTDNAGKTASASLQLNYDATPPTITGWKPSRPPDHNGWYNHSVKFAFTGTDATSGLEACTTPKYTRPDGARASVLGSCRDRAGNVATLAARLRYDSTPPCLSADADAGDEIVFLHWRACASLQIVRCPGQQGKHSNMLYHGSSGAFTDTRVRNGVRYRYTLSARDQAGNMTVRNIVITPGPRLLAPGPNAHLATPPLLRWTPVRQASYLVRGVSAFTASGAASTRHRCRSACGSRT